jgi:hypothetical protein
MEQHNLFRRPKTLIEIYCPRGDELKADGQAKMNRKSYAPALDALLTCFLDYTTAHEMTADDLRTFANDKRELDLLALAHPNSWGALFTRAAKAGILHGTGRYVSSTNPSRHGGKIQVWERTAKTFAR